MAFDLPPFNHSWKEVTASHVRPLEVRLGLQALNLIGVNLVLLWIMKWFRKEGARLRKWIPYSRLMISCARVADEPKGFLTSYRMLTFISAEVLCLNCYGWYPWGKYWIVLPNWMTPELVSWDEIVWILNLMTLNWEYKLILKLVCRVTLWLVRIFLTVGT